jgi:hypothetical protein
VTDRAVDCRIDPAVADFDPLPIPFRCHAHHLDAAFVELTEQCRSRSSAGAIDNATSRTVNARCSRACTGDTMMHVDVGEQVRPERSQRSSALPHLFAVLLCGCACGIAQRLSWQVVAAAGLQQGQ